MKLYPILQIEYRTEKIILNVTFILLLQYKISRFKFQYVISIDYNKNHEMFWERKPAKLISPGSMIRWGVTNWNKKKI